MSTDTLTALRERLTEALQRDDNEDMPWYGSRTVEAKEMADALTAALGDDAARLEAALAPDAVTVTVEDVARRLGRGPGWSKRVAEARRLLGIDGGQ